MRSFRPSPVHLYLTLGIVAMAGLTWLQGIRGFYFFDLSIPLSSGWYVLNGWAPFRDYATPLMPLNATLVAAAYWLFGVRYVSTVILAALLAGAVFATAFLGARRLVSPQVAFFLTAVATLGTLPAIGTLFYNHIASALLLCYGIFALRLIAVSDEEAALGVRLAIGIILALLLLTKAHLGLLFLGLHTLLEWHMLRRPFDLSPIVRRGLCLVGPSVVAMIVVLIWIGGDVGALLKNLGTGDPGAQLVTVWQNLTQAAGLAKGPLDNPIFSTFFLLVLIIAIALAWKDEPAEIKRRRSLRFCFMFVICVQGISLVSAESAATQLYLFPVVFLAFVAHAPKEQRRLLVNMVGAMTTAIGGFSLIYNLDGMRKAFNETAFTFTNGVGPAAPSGNGFFAGVALQPEYVDILQSLDAFRRSHPPGRIFFGPGLEALFPASNQLPPHGWANWFHAGISYSKADTPSLREKFARARYDYVLIAVRRDPILTPLIQRDYHGCARPSDWTVLYCRN